jgi:hypothetical protein
MSSTTESVESVQSLEVTIDLKTVLDALKEFGCADLFKVIKMSTQEAEKRVKSGSKVKKEEDGPKKPTPSQLQKPTAWVRFTLQRAQQDGWEEFIICNRKSGEEILMPASEEVDGKHVYPGGKEMILTHAMSLSKQRWAPKANEGTHEELYNEFLAEFETAAAAAEAPEEAPEWLVPPTIVRKTAEEKAAEVAAKKAEIEAKKAEKKEERERAKAEAKLAKEAEKAAAKEAKVPKAAVKVVKPAPKPVVKAAAAKVEVKASGKEEATTPRSLSAEPVKTARKPTTANAKAAAWTCPADGAVHPWAYKGMAYLRNSDNQVWKEDADGGCGDWCGVFLGGEDRIDDSVEEPDFE